MLPTLLNPGKLAYPRRQLIRSLGSLRLAVSPARVSRTLPSTPVDKLEALLGTTWYNRLLKLPTKYMFGLDHAEKLANPRITVYSAEYAALKGHLRPGDVILCGNDDSFVHGIVYLGNGEIVHSLAQEPIGRPPNLIDWLTDRAAKFAEALPGPAALKNAVAMRFRAFPKSMSDGLGVIHETMDAYFGRSHRDNVVIVRNPMLQPEDLRKMRKFAFDQVGKPYDYAFSTFDDSRFYCTELVVRTLQQASNPPRIAGIYGGAGPIRREMFLNEGILKSTDLEVVWTSRSYERTPFGKANPLRIARSIPS